MGLIGQMVIERIRWISVLEPLVVSFADDSQVILRVDIAVTGKCDQQNGDDEGIAERESLDG